MRSGRSVGDDLDHARSDDAALDHVALLELLGDRVVLFLGVFDPHDGLMEVRVELLADGLDVLKAVLLEDFLELREDHLDALLEGLHILCLGRHRALEVVEQRQHVLAEILRDDSGNLFAFLRRAAAEVVKICLEAQQAIDYEAADAAFGQEDYAAALKLYQKLGSYKDARGLAARTAYLWGCSLMENEQYKQAQSCFEQAGNYQNAADKVLEANYLYAGQLLDEGNYAEAINQYKACGSYQDAAGKILDSKYGYAENNLDQSNKTTLKYISELIAAGYPGAKDLEDALYAWKAEFLGFNNSPTKTDAQGRISKYYTMYAHFRVTGGRDGETTTVRARLVAPNGSRGTITFENCWSGGEYYVSFFYYDPAAGATGTITASIYSDKGVYLAGGSAEVVD